MQWSGRSSQTPLWDGTCSPTVLLVPAGTIDGGTAETACSWTGAEELSRGSHHHCSSAGVGPFIPRPDGRCLLAQARPPLDRPPPHLHQVGAWPCPLTNTNGAIRPRPDLVSRRPSP